MPKKSPPGGSGGQVIITRIFKTFVEVCLIQRGWHIHHNYSPGLFNNPSGKRDRGETRDQAAEREFWEESCAVPTV